MAGRTFAFKFIADLLLLLHDYRRRHHRDWRRHGCWN